MIIWNLEGGREEEEEEIQKKRNWIDLFRVRYSIFPPPPHSEENLYFPKGNWVKIMKAIDSNYLKFSKMKQEKVDSI